MSLNLQEAAQLLGVSPETVRRWARQGHLGVMRPSGEPAFEQPELERWAQTRGLRLKVPARGGGGATAVRVSDSVLVQSLYRGGILRNFEAADREQALAAMIAQAPLAETVEREDLLDQLRQREQLSSTGLGHGVALPHPRTPSPRFAAEPFVCLGLFRTPIDWQAIDGEPVHSALLLLSPSPAVHLQVLSRVAFLLRDAEFTAMLARQDPDEAILAAIEAREPNAQ